MSSFAHPFSSPLPPLPPPLSQSLNFKAFPFDRQTLDIHMVTTNATERGGTVKFIGSATGDRIFEMGEGSDNNGWNVDVSLTEGCRTVEVVAERGLVLSRFPPPPSLPFLRNCSSGNRATRFRRCSWTKTTSAAPRAPTRPP